MTVVVATLIHGLNYHVKGKVYTQGYPQIVTTEEAARLHKALHESQTIMNGQRVAFRRFKLQEMDEAKAKLILDKYGEKQPEKVEEKFLIQEAVTEDMDEEYTLEELDDGLGEVEDYVPPKPVKSPGRPRKEADS